MKRLILFLCATLLCGAAALAQTYQETVYLKNGSIIKGTVLEQEAGGNIKIMTSDGSIFVYKSDEVQKITKEAVSSSRSKSSKGTASADGKAFRGWRVSPGLGIGTTFGDYAMASGVLEFGLGKDVSDQIYLGFGAQGSIPFKEGVDPSFSAFLENRIYFPSSSSVSFLLRDRLAFHPDFDHDNHSAGLVVAPGVMFPLSPSLDMVLTGGYQLGILLDGGTASHSLLFNATFDFHRRSAKKERDLAPYRRKGIEIGGGIGVANTTYLNESRGEGSVIWDPLMALFIGYRFNPHISLGIEGCLGAFTFVPDTDAISTGMESTAPAFFLTGRYRFLDKVWSPVAALSLGTAPVLFDNFIDRHRVEEKANGLLAIPRIGLSHRSRSGNGHLEFTVGYQKGSVLKKFNDVRYTRSSPEFSVRYYHTLGFGAKAFDSVNLPEILK